MLAPDAMSCRDLLGDELAQRAQLGEGRGRLVNEVSLGQCPEAGQAGCLTLKEGEVAGRVGHTPDPTGVASAYKRPS